LSGPSQRPGFPRSRCQQSAGAQDRRDPAAEGRCGFHPGGSLRRYRIPVFVFVNKMDQEGTDRQALMREMQKELDPCCIDFSDQEGEAFYENLAMCDEGLLEKFLENAVPDTGDVQRLIAERKVFPCFFGSALKFDGVNELMAGLAKYTALGTYEPEFGAAVYKIGRDEQGSRLTYMKITGGSLKVRDLIETGTADTPGDEESAPVTEKVHQIRLYSGTRYETVSQVEAGCVCAVTGLEHTMAGQTLGGAGEVIKPYLEPVLAYSLEFPEGYDKNVMISKLRILEEECPEMHITWEEETREIRVQVMGEVQIEILKSLIRERFGVEAEFSEGNIVYKETIAAPVEGIGHFEPLRHYAEVHLILEPLKRGSGLEFDCACSEDALGRNWQRLILTHLRERIHRGVLTGAAITDMRITLMAGQAHLKHTEGGDFRQATYRAVRQGLKKAESVLLEPYYAFRLVLPRDLVGRAMTDIEKQGGRFDAPQIVEETAILEGIGPVSGMRNYQKDVTAYTKGKGRLTLAFHGYEECVQAQEIIAAKGYDSESDYRQPTGSVFCSHGAGMYVPWDEVERYMHLPSVLEPKGDNDVMVSASAAVRSISGEPLATEEIDEILYRASHANTRSAGNERQKLRSKKPSDDYPVIIRKAAAVPKKDRYLLVDGYNVIFAWEDLRELAAVNIDGARGRLLDILCNYQAVRGCELIAVFDAYRVKGHDTEIMDYHNIHVVFTREAETADQYIEKFTHEHGKKYDISVATSDGLEQIIVTGQGARLISSRELLQDIRLAEREIRENLENLH
ncbi:MAG: TetM/TetW/TetO/TetS family tetracycline resistance ribosomal protection protein, partial [Lachnospiraceae bacterium]|nr:TetM/TetW/TetO/TetS family tetracycline resistance ribosomal protection protein [Lachnospiraceae bacterium]